MHPVVRGLGAAFPIALGYFPVAVSFGLGAQQVGWSPLEAAFVSAVMYSGAAQFVALTLIASGTAPLVTIVTLVLMGVRHLFYGPTLVRTQPGATVRKSAVWAYGLTDEVFAVALGALSRKTVAWNESWLTGLGLGAYLTWVSGTVLGAWLGGLEAALPPVLNDALAFMLPALFFALLLALLTRGTIIVIGGALAATALATTFVSGAGPIFFGMGVAALIAYVREPRDVTT